MKHVRIVAFAMAVVLTGCPIIFDPTNGGDNGEDASDSDDQLGTLQVTISVPITTTAWDNSDVSSLASEYEILVYNSTDQVTSGAIGTGGTHDLSVPTGTFDVLVFAGVAQGDPQYVDILGLGEAESVVVQAGETTNVSIGIDTFSWTTSWPTGQVETGSTQPITAEVSLPTDAISFDSLAPDTLWFYAEYYDVTWTRTGIAQWHVASEIVAPDVEGSFQCSFLPLYSWHVNLSDSDYSLSGSLEGYTDRRWGLAGGNTFQDYPNSPMYAEFRHDIGITEPTALSVDIGWNPDS